MIDEASPNESDGAAELANMIRTLTHYLSGLWTMEDPGENMREVILQIGLAKSKAGGSLPAEKARHVLQRARIIIGRDRDIDWYCNTPEEAVAFVKRRLTDAYQQCGKELEDLAAELLLLGESKGREHTADDVQWSEPMTPKALRKIFNVSQDTLAKRLADQQIRNWQLSTKSYKIHVDDLPKSVR